MYGRGYVSEYDFAKTLQKHRVSEDDIYDLVPAFSKNKNQVSHELFMATLVDHPSEFRKDLARNTFNNELDRSRSGYLAVSILKSFFNARNHPDVRSGKAAEEEVLREFSETLRLYLGNAQKITREDFVKYYGYVSFCTPDDKRFRALMNIWTTPKEEVERPRRRYESKEVPRHYGARETPIAREKLSEYEGRCEGKHEVDERAVEYLKESIVAKGVRCLFGIYRGFRVPLSHIE